MHIKNKKVLPYLIFKVIAYYKLYWCTTSTITNSIVQTLLDVDYKLIFKLKFYSSQGLSKFNLNL